MIEKNPVVFGLLWIAAGALILFWEWRRAARKNRAWRLLSATASLVSLWVFWSTRATPSAASTSQILLYTPSLDTTPAMKPAPGEKVYALPGAQAPDGVTIIPDLGFLWRSNPTLQVLRVAGDGIQKVDTPVPPDVRVVAVAAPLPPRSGRISEVDFPSSINVGDSFKIRGLVQVTPADSNLLIELSEPDGTVSAAQSLGNGTGEFSLDTFPAKTAGNFRWRLTLSRREGTKPMQTLETEEIGMEVRTETPPALLLLESSPRLDTARLRDWYQRMRGKFFSRTQVGKERFQYSAVGMPTPPVIHLSSEFLQQFRVIIIDETSESYLAPDESAALRHGLVEGKLGVLVIGPPAAATAAASSARKLFTGPVVSLPSDDDTLLDRRARLIAVGTARLPAAPVDVENFEITATDAQRILLRDPQERVVAAAGLRQGEGWVARSLVRNTWKWERGDEAGAFALYWAWLLGAVAPARSSIFGSVSEARPVVGESMQILWTGISGESADKFPRGSVKAEQLVSGNVSLALRQDEFNRSLWSATYWPHEPGWHRASLPNGVGQFSFWVNSAGAWPGVRAEEARIFTRNLVARNPSPTGKPESGPSNEDSSWLAWAIAVAGMSYLWGEARVNQRR